MKTSSSSLAAAMLSTAALFTHAVFADDACCKDSCCDQKPDVSAYGLTGDWGGVRNTLKEKGYEFQASYTAELFGNPKGGKHRSAIFEGLLRLSLKIDLQKAVGWNDATFSISGFYPHGTSGTQRNVGDASLFSNIDSYDTYRLVDFWIEQKLMDGKLGLKVGQMKIDDEFGVTNTAALFINATFGVPNPPSTRSPLPTYPVGALGFRLRFEPLEGFYGMVGVYDGNSSPGDFADPSTGSTGEASRHGTDWALREDEGALWASEIGYQRTAGGYPGSLKLGFLSHTARFADVSGDGSTHPSSTSSYYVLDQTLWQKSQGSKEGLSGFLRGTLAQKASSYMDRTTQLGLVYTGITGEEDKLGLAYACNHFSPNQTDNGIQKTRETVTELSYQIPLQPYLRVQPDLQYISRPGGTDVYNNAWVIGIRAILDF